MLDPRPQGLIGGLAMKMTRRDVGDVIFGKVSNGQMFHFRRDKDDQPGGFPVEIQVSS